jgi:hypothetical protein
VTTINTNVMELENARDHSAGVGQGRAISPPSDRSQAAAAGSNDFSDGTLRCAKLAEFIDLARRDQWRPEYIVDEIVAAIYHGRTTSSQGEILVRGLAKPHACKCAGHVMLDVGA